MKKLFLTVFIVFPIIGYLVFLIQFKLRVGSNELNLNNSTHYYDYKGVTNVHTSLSTGSLPPKDVIEAASELGFDFLFLTEVNTFPTPKFLDAYHGTLLTITAGEYSYLDSRLLFYNGAEDQPPEQRGQSQVFFSDRLSHEATFKDGFVILAHPFLKGQKWTGDFPVGLRGVEILNLKKVLDEAWTNSKLSSIGSLLMYPFNPHLALIRLYLYPDREIDLWDDLNSKQKTIAMFGADATAKAVIASGVSIEFPSYKTSLAIGSNHVLLKSELTGDYEKDRNKILKAIFDGQFYVAMDIIANPKGFYAEVKDARQTYPMGSELKLGKETKLIVELPRGLEAPFEIQLFKDGKVHEISNRKSTKFNITSPGAYRAVVRVIPIFPLPGGKRWLPWIYTNAFYIR
jgi:hypothetical protein